MGQERDALGPVLMPRGAVYQRAREIEALARRAAELSVAGPRCDLLAAQRQLDRIAAICGPSESGEG